MRNDNTKGVTSEETTISKMVVTKKGIWSGDTMAKMSLLPYPPCFIYPQNYIKIGDTMGKTKCLCEQCGQEFEGYLTKSKGRFCSRKCSTTFNRKKKVKQLCLFCGKMFKVHQSIIDIGKGKFCSLKCFNEYRKKQRVLRFCKNCKNRFSIPICKVRQGYGIFCAKKCQSQWMAKDEKTKKHLREIGRNQKGPTKPERIFEKICMKHHLPFRFVGDGSLWLGNANPDFIHNTRKLCIEIYGDYWHSPLLNATIHYNHTCEGRKRQLKAKGYMVIFLWESDLLRTDSETFVLNLLRKKR